MHPTGDSEMTEPIEQWREEHKNLLISTGKWCLANFHELDGSYYDWHLQASWEGFLMAKRAQKPVELPNAKNIIFSSALQENGFVTAIEYVSEILAEQGIPYTVKGE